MSNNLLANRELSNATHLLETVGLNTPKILGNLLEHAKPLELARGYYELHNLSLLTPEFIQTLKQSNHPKQLGLIIAHLNQVSLLNEKNLKKIMVHPRYSALEYPIKLLMQASLLDSSNLKLLIHHAQPEHFASNLVNLNQANLLTEANKKLLVEHTKLEFLSPTLSNLLNSELLSQENFSSILAESENLNLAKAIEKLYQIRQLNQFNFDHLLSSSSPLALAEAITALAREKIASLKLISLISTNPQPKIIGFILARLNKHGLLNNNNLMAILSHFKPDLMNFALSILELNRILNQTHFEQIISLVSPQFNQILMKLHEANILNRYGLNMFHSLRTSFLLTREANEILWNNLPSHYLGLHWNEIILAAQTHNPALAMQTLVHQFLNRPDEMATHPASSVFNSSQSTHTKSVNESVLAGIKKLISLYGNSAKLEESQTQLRTYIDNLDEEPIHQVAKRGFKRLTSSYPLMLDEDSGLNILQLLTLAFHAIHDESKRLGDINSAKQEFILALYEIQRGYNIDEFGKDNGLTDSPVCTTGSFHKVIEKLHGIHADMDMKYMSYESANLKFLALVQQHCLRYLKQIASPTTYLAYQMSMHLLHQLQTNGKIELIWPKIKTAVENELWDEFQELYYHNRHHSKFQALLEYANDCPLPNLSQMMIKIQDSPGYHDYLSHTLVKTQDFRSLSQYSLWSKRQESPENQQEFDRHFGLVRHSSN